MGGRVGGISHINYKETRGMKVSGGMKVKAGTLLTREGHRWQAGQNVIGLTNLTAACDGEVFFTRRSGSYRKSITLVHIRPEKEPKKTRAVKKTAE